MRPMSNASRLSPRLSIHASILTALLFATGCQVGLSSLAKRAGLGADEPPAQTAQTAQPSEPFVDPGDAVLAQARADHAARMAEREAYDEAHPESGDAPVSRSRSQPEPVARAAPAPTCSKPGRAAVCDGVCVDVQADSANCGECDYKCSSGSRCDFGTCRDAEGKPASGSRY